jgi:D-3-phosphoglycerate dehydrogenase
MSEVVDSLILDLLAWLAREERSYDDTMEAWRTSCPRLPVWEDANTRGLVAHAMANGQPVVRLTPSGRALLAAHQRTS